MVELSVQTFCNLQKGGFIVKFCYRWTYFSVHSFPYKYIAPRCTTSTKIKKYKIMNYITFPVTMTLLYESEGDWCTVLSQLFFTWKMQLQILNGNAFNFRQLGKHMDICEMVEFMKYHFLPVIYKAPQILVSKSLMSTFLLLINKETWTSITLFVLHIKWLEPKPRDLKG